MTFLISLLLAAAFLWLCAKPLRKHPVPFYLAAAVISVTVIALYWGAPEFLSAAARTKLPVYLSAFGTALFVFVMIPGALPNGNPLLKTLMPIRGELSIFACILTLGHNISFAKNYFTPGALFSGPITTTKLAAWISLVLIALMLVLTVTSFKAVRKKMKPKKWKSLQRSAYGFYALTYIHVMLMSIPAALRGRSGYMLTILVYSIVYLGYGVCRVQKAVLAHGKTRVMVSTRRQLSAAVCAVLLAVGVTAWVARSTTVNANTMLQAETAAPAPEQTPETPAPQIEEEIPALPEEEKPADEAVKTDEEIPEANMPLEQAPPTEAETEVPQEVVEAAAPAVTTDEKPAETANSQPAAPEPAAAPEPEATPEPAPEPEPPAVVRVYQDGTFTGSGEGFEGTITVSVTIQSDVITAVSVVSASEDEPFWTDGKTVINSIIAANSTNVDTVSGATFSSRGIIDAVKSALNSAKN